MGEQISGKNIGAPEELNKIRPSSFLKWVKS